MKTAKRHTAHTIHTMKALFSLAVALSMVISLAPTVSFAQGTAGQASSSAGTDASASSASSAADVAAHSSSAASSTSSAATASQATTPASSAAKAAMSPRAAAVKVAQAKAPAPIVAIGSTTYTTLADVAKAAKAGDTITLLTDVDATGAGTLDISGMTLDLAGRTISAKNFTLIFEGQNATIKNGTFNALGGSYGLFIGNNGTTDNFTVQDVNVVGGVNVFNASNVVLRNVNADAAATNSLYYAVWCDVNAQVIIESGTYTSDGAAIVGLSDNDQGAPASVLDIRGGNFYTKSSPLALPGDNRYMPTISGGTFPHADEIEPLLQSDARVLGETDGRVEVAKAEGDVKPAANESVPDSYQLISTHADERDTSAIADAVSHPDIAQALQAAGGTEHLWAVNVTLQNTKTLEEDHEHPMTFMLAYPDDVDATKYDKYDFVVLHMKTVEHDGTETVEPEILPAADVQAEADGLQIHSTLSTFAISYRYDPPAPADKPQTPATKPATPDATQSTTAQTTQTEPPAAVESGNAGSQPKRPQFVTGSDTRIHSGNAHPISILGTPIAIPQPTYPAWPLWVACGAAVVAIVVVASVVAYRRSHRNGRQSAQSTR